jgi:hypothetical protein
VTTGGGTPTLTLNTTPNRTATYASGTGTTTLVFNYTVQAGDTMADLEYVATNSLVLNGGTISDLATNDAVLTLPAPLPAVSNSLGNNKNIEIDTTADAAPGTPNLLPADDSGASDSDDLTNVLIQRFDLSCVTGSSVQLYADNGVTNVVTGLSSICAGGTVQLTTGTLVGNPDTSYTITAVQTDPAGNVSPASTAIGVYVNTIVPATLLIPDLDSTPVTGSDTGSSLTDDITNDTTPTFTGSCVTGNTITVYNGAFLVDTVTCSGSLYSSTPIVPFAEGVHSITVYQRDIVGNISLVSPALSITIDTTAPGAAPGTPNLDSGSDSGTYSTDDETNDTTPTFTISCLGTNTVKLEDGTNTVVGTGTCAAGTVTITVAPALVAQGAHLFHAYQEDTAGNATADSADITITLDTVLASAPVTVPDLTAGSDTAGVSTTDNITYDTTPTFTGSCTDDEVVKLYKDGVYVAPSYTCVASAYTFTPTITNGTYSITTTFTDLAGNESASASPALSLTVDTVNPVAPGEPDLDSTAVTGSDTGSSLVDNITADNTPTFTITCTNGDTIDLRQDGVVVDTDTCAGGIVTVSAPAISPDGTYDFDALITDTAGNTNASTILSVEIDTAEAVTGTPNMTAGTDTGSSPSDDNTSNTTPAFTISCDTTATVTLYVDGIATLVTGTCVGSTVTLIAPTLASDGIFDIKALQTDPAGNVSALSAGLSITIDNTVPTTPGSAPDLTTDTGTSATDNITGDNTPDFDVVCSAVGDEIKFYSNNPAPGTLIYTHTCTTATTESVTITPALSDGVHSITYTITDLAGNTSGASPAVSVTIDTLTPTTPGSAPDLTTDTGTSATDNITGDNTPDFDVVCSAVGDQIKFYSNNPAPGTLIYTHTCTTATTESVTITPALSDGVHSITYTITDLAGNTSGASPAVSVTIDTTLPTITATAPATNAYINTQQVSYTLSETAGSGTIVFTGTGGSDNGVVHTCTLQGTALNTGAHTNLTLTTGANACVTWATPLVDGNQYSVVFNTTDLAGNVATTVTNTGVTYDTTTPTITATAPATNAYINTQQVSYTLSEGVQSGTITFVRTSGTADAGSPHTCTLTGAGLNTGVHTNTLLTGPECTGWTNLVDGAVYTVTFNTTDLAGNVATTVTNTGVTYDTTTPTITATAPATNAYINTQQVSYTLSEGVQSGTITFVRTSGTADAGSPHTCTLTGAGLNTGVHTNTLLTGPECTGWTNLVDGAVYTVTFNTTDLAGNVATTVTNTGVTYDTTAPGTPGAPDLDAGSDTGVSDTDNITADVTPTFTGSCTINDTIKLYDSLVLITSVLCTTGTYSITSTVLTNGIHHMNITATDLAGNASGASIDLDVTIDNTPPANPGSSPDMTAGTDLGSSSTDDLTSNPTPSFTGTCNHLDTAFVNLYLDGSYVTPVGEIACLVNDTYTVAPLLALSNGAHTMTVKFENGGGVESLLPSTGLPITIDTTLPTITATAPATNAYINTQQVSYTLSEAVTSGTITFTRTGGTADAGSPHTCTLTGAGLNTGVHTNTLLTGPECTGWTNLVDGAVYTVTFNTTDLAGNVATTVTNTGVTYDTTAPGTPGAPDLDAGSDTGVSDTDNITADVTPTFTGSCTINDTIKLYDSLVLITSVLCTTGTYSITSTVLTNGIHHMNITATDLAGNASGASIDLDVTIDNTPPANPGSSPDMTAGTDLGSSSTDDLTSNPTPSFTGTCNHLDTAFVNLYLDGSYVTPVGEIACLVNDTYTVAPLLALSNGAHTMTVKFENGGGVESLLPSTGLPITIDTTLPTITATAPATNAYINTQQVSYTLSEAVTSGTITFTRTGGTADAGSPHTCTLTGAGLNTGVHTNTLLTGPECTGWTNLVDGAVYTVTFNTTDLAGNVATTVTNTGVTYDTTAPNNASYTSIGGDITAPYYVNTTTPSVIINSLTVGDTVTIPGWTCAPTPAVGATVTCTHPGLTPDGAYTVAPTITDLAGNATVSPSTTINVDTGAPNNASYTSIGGDITAPYYVNTTTPSVIINSLTVGDTVTIPGWTCAPTPAVGATVTCTHPGLTPDGAYTVAPTITDLAGNATVSPSTTINVDTGAPNNASYTSIGGDITAPYYVNTTTPSVIINSLTVGDTVTIPGWTCAPTPAVGATVTCTHPGLTPDGAYTVAPTITDLAGNATVSPSTTINVDTTAPSTQGAPDLVSGSDTGVSSNDDLTNDTTPSITVSCEIGASVQLYVDAVANGLPVTCTTGTLILTTTVLSGSPVATYLITTTQTDLAGNTSAISPPLSVTIDTIPPALAPVVLGVITPASATTQTTTPVTVTGIAGSIPDGTYIEIKNGGTVLCTATVTATAFTCSIALTAGTVNYSLIAYDDAGNPLATPYTLTYTAPSSGGGGGGGGSTDFCSNIAGAQTSLPAGYTRVGTTCTPISTAPVVCAVGEVFNRNTGERCTATSNTNPTTPNTKPITPIPATDDVNACTPLITGNILIGRQNDPNIVNTLLTFLNDTEGENLVLDGTYDADDILAVKRFQTKYFNEIIAPWGGRVATGNVAGYTRGKINVMNCGKTFGCPYFTQYAKLGSLGGDVGRIQNFLNLLMNKKLNEPAFNTTVYNAVREYQTLYRRTVLTPLGLTQATGNWMKYSTQTANGIIGCRVQ